MGLFDFYASMCILLLVPIFGILVFAFMQSSFVAIYLFRRSVGFTVRNAAKDAWRSVRGIY